MRAKLVSADGLTKEIEIPGVRPMRSIVMPIVWPLHLGMVLDDWPPRIDIPTREYELYSTANGLEYREKWIEAT